MKTHLILGAGKMTRAIFLGLSKKVDMKKFTFYTPSIVSAKALAEEIGANYVETLPEQLNFDYIWLGIKPQGLSNLKGVGAKLPSHSTLISMLAAIDEKTQLETLGAKKLIRVMPNLPVEFNKGVTLISTDSAQDRVHDVVDLFSKLGEEYFVSEQDLEKLTLLTGSGPAFIYEFTKLLGQQFEHKDAQKLVRSVLIGSAHTVQSKDTPLEDLIDSVTSKGGVTIAVLNKWRESGLEDLLKAGIRAGNDRSKELSQK